MIILFVFVGLWVSVCTIGGGARSVGVTQSRRKSFGFFGVAMKAAKQRAKKNKLKLVALARLLARHIRPESSNSSKRGELPGNPEMLPWKPPAPGKRL